MMGKFTFAFFLFISIFLTATGQTVTINSIDNGPYGNGSDISVPVKITDASGLLKTNNVFNLYISDASGSFLSERLIGTYPGFYTTFINGVIPADLPSGNYKVRVKSTAPATVSLPSAEFKVNAQTGVKAEIDANSSQVITNNPKTFGVCKPERSTNFKFTNSSTPGANVTVSVKNELNISDSKQYTIESSPISIAAEMAHYTIFVKAELNGIIGTKAYFLINNVIKPGFNSPANNTVCLPAVLEYDIETASSNGIQNNFPGYSYQINWGDDAIENVTPNQIIANSGKVKHTYNRSSCGKQIKINDVNYYNVFGIIYQVNSPFCGLVSVPLSTQAKVITQPENRFALPSAVCLNADFSLNNMSIAGDNPSGNSPECQNNSVVYYWYVDGQPVTPQGVPISYKLNHKFTTPGVHTIRLESESNSNCQAAPLERITYVQAVPKPAFTLTETLACAGAVIKAADQSVLDTGLKAQNIYSWTVKGPSNVTYVNNTSSSSKNPEFKFGTAGIYTVQLTITSPCGPISTEQTVVINEKPSIATNWQTNLCGKGQLLTFNSSNGNTVNTSFGGTAQPESNTYNWIITGGAFSFKNNTNANSKEPAILFEAYATYTIRITHQNNCGSETVTKTLIFNESPTVSAGIDQLICAGSTTTLNASITGGNTASFKWIGGAGNFSPSRNVLNPIYTPTKEEVASGEVLLKFSVTTQNPAPCNLVEDVMILKINPVNKITSAAAKTICTNTAINYLPTALLEGSSISWTATGSANAKGFSETGSGEIKDVVTNTDPTKEATITYTLTPKKNGCQGDSFTFVVTITATPKVTAKPANGTICSGKESVVDLSSNLPGMRYTWTSTVNGSITGNSKQSTPVALTAIKDTLTNAGNATGSVIYTITPENVTGCTGEAIKITVNVSASPGISTFSPNKTTGCSPLAITFSNTTPGSLNKYYWDFGD
ncbi:MAG: PKD-like domain-containing protein, partial [Sphingobacteriaceae bacterium]